MSPSASFLDSEWPERLRRGVQSVLKRCGVANSEWTAQGYDVHHIVAAGLGGAAPGRAVLARWSVGVHSVANAVVLPRSFHQQEGLHRLAFLQLVNQRLVSAEMFGQALSPHAGSAAGRLIIVQTMQKIGNELVLRSGDAVAIRVQAALQGLASDGAPGGGGSCHVAFGSLSASGRRTRKQKCASVEGAERPNAPILGQQRFGFQLATGCC